MLKSLRNLLPLALVAMLAVGPASAQTACSERAPMVEQLEKSYKEVPQAIGLSSDGSVFEVFASESGNWTVLVTRPNGVSCVFASGEAWEQVPVKVLGPTA